MALVPILVPPWFMIAVVFTLPVLHFSLLSNPHLSNLIVTCTGVFVLVTVPISITTGDDILVDFVLRGVAMVYFLLRVIEMSTFPRTLTSKWSLIDYYEFIAISDNEPVRKWTAKRTKPASKTNLWRPKLVTYEDRTLLYYIWQVGRLGVVFFFLALSSAYLEKYPFQSQTRKLKFLMPWDITGILEAVALGTKCMSILDLAYTIGTLPIVHLVKAPYIPVLDSPYLSTSLRDFWSNRWNQPIKITIHRIAFAPTLKYLEHVNGGINRRHFNMVATMSAFVWSSLLHEYVCAMLVHEHWIPGEQSVFFLLHGIGCILVEVCGVNQFTKRFGSFMGNMLGWLATAVFFLITSPFFVGPYARTGIGLPVPPLALEYLKQLI